MSNLTYNFRIEESSIEGIENVITKKLVDTRNGIEVINLVPGFESYLNYLDLLMYYKSKWISNCFLDLGMIPVIYGPSFLHTDLANILIPLANQYGLKLTPMPFSSFMLRVKPGNEANDYWVTREEAAKFLDCEELEVTSSAIINKLRGV